MTLRMYLGTLFSLALAAVSEAKEYQVKNGDFLTKIAAKTGQTVEEILQCNPGLNSGSILHPGQSLALSQAYRIQEEDSLLGIAYAHGTTLSELLDLNPQLKDEDLIYPGQRLSLPCRKASQKKQPRLEETKEESQKSVPKKKQFTKKRLKFPSGLELEVVTDPRLIGKGQEFYDPWSSGNPLVRVRAGDLDEKVSKYFTLGEFARIETPSLVRKEYTQTRWGDIYYTHLRLEPDLLKRLDRLRAKLNRPVQINSGYRSYGYNDRLYRKVYHRQPTKSRHCSGDGVDIDLGYKAIRRTAEYLFADGGIGKGSTFTHLDTRGRNARWKY
ncbi:MAG TPA: LysM peptidoglycan-binding domain-containing protein [Candidatus Nanoarchaeia archaeon]|nr:LysM peptidoglycan-binding domain-containing protein [Candidatus Nanoarchaeia archaeon]